MNEKEMKCVNDKNIDKQIYSEYISKSEEETEIIAYNVAKVLSNKNIIVLTGELGAGKTKFVYGITNYFGVSNQMSSPTFTIVNEYTVNKDKLKFETDIQTIYHFDVYRLKDVNDFIDSVGLEYFDNGLCIIEWGEIIKEILPENAIYISIERVEENENYRKISISKSI